METNVRREGMKERVSVLTSSCVRVSLSKPVSSLNVTSLC